MNEENEVMNETVSEETVSERIRTFGSGDIQRATEESTNDYRGAETESMEETVPMGVSNNEVRGISINPLSSGYMVKVGCQSVAVETTERLVDMLQKYLSDPADFERKWYSKNVRNRLENI